MSINKKNCGDTVIYQGLLFNPTSGQLVLYPNGNTVDLSSLITGKETLTYISDFSYDNGNIVITYVGEDGIPQTKSIFIDTGHVHPISDIIGLQEALDERVWIGDFVAAMGYKANLVGGEVPKYELPLDIIYTEGLDTALLTKQDQLNGEGFVKISGTTVSYDNNSYLTTSSAAGLYQPILVSGTNIKTVNGQSLIGSGDITTGGSAVWGAITGTLTDQTDLSTALNDKSDIGHTHAQSDITNLVTDLAAKQSTLVSGTNIKTINGGTILGSGDLSVVTTNASLLTSGTLDNARLSSTVALENVTNTFTEDQIIFKNLATLTLRGTASETLGYRFRDSSDSSLGGFSQNIGTGDMNIETHYGTGSPDISIAYTGGVTLSSLAGTGAKYVKASVTGLLSGQVGIPQADVANLVSDLSGKQATLVSGTNIKTVNGTSLLGSGDVTISTGVAWGAITGTLSSQTDLQSALNLKANLASPTFTGTVVLPSTTAIGSVSSTELGYLDGVTSAIQTQIDGKQPQINGTGFVKATGTTISYDNSTYLTTSTAASTYQPLDSDLTTIAGLTATTDNFIVSVSSAWASRTPAQVKTTLALDNVDNTSDATKWAATATLTNKDLTSGTNTFPTSLVTLTGTQTLTNKTLTDPIFTGTASPSYAQGKLVYDTTNEALTFYNNDSNVSLQIGQENWIRVRNDTGSSISNGSAVYISGVHASGLPQISLAQANSGATTVAAGLVTETIANNSIGYVTSIGLVRNVNTSSFANGAILFLSATTPGALTTTAPSAPNYRYRVGIVTNSHASNGTIHVTPSTAALANGTNNQILGISGSGIQEFKTISGDGLVNVTHAANSIALSLTDNFSHKSSMVGWWYPLQGSAAANTSQIMRDIQQSGGAGVGTSTFAGGVSTNMFTALPGVVFATNAGASSYASTRAFNTNILFWRGNAAGLGGFEYSAIFGNASAATVANQKIFVGLYNSGNQISTTTDPGGFTNVIGCGADLSTDTNLQIYHNDGSGSATKIDLGANFPITTLSTDLYYVSFTCDPNGSTVNYRAVRLNTGDTASGTLSTNLPSSTTFLNATAYTTNGTTALAAGIKLFKQYMLLKGVTV